MSFFFFNPSIFKGREFWKSGVREKGKYNGTMFMITNVVCNSLLKKNVYPTMFNGNTNFS
jgi:hypothetical protein